MLLVSIWESPTPLCMDNKIYYSMFMRQYYWNSEYSLFYGRFYLLRLSYQMVKKLFKFVWRFGTTHHERHNKIHVHGYFQPCDKFLKYYLKLLKRVSAFVRFFLAGLYKKLNWYMEINKYLQTSTGYCMLFSILL